MSNHDSCLLERILSGTPCGSRKLRLSVYHHPHRTDSYEGRGVLNLPGRTLTAQFACDDLDELLEGLADRLASTAIKYKEKSASLIRNDRKQRVADDLAAALPLLSWDEKADRKESFFSTLRPLLGFLERQARSELKVYELEGKLCPDQVEAEEVVSEVILAAWEKFNARPDNLSLELWLARLMKEVLEKIEREHRFVSLYQRVASADAPYAEQSDWLEEVLGPKEEFTLAELLPDHEETEKWEMLDDEERSHHFYLELQKYPSRQRQAYLMSGTEGYSLEDVSKVQERSIADVEDDVQKSQKAMGDYMEKAGMVKKRSKFSGC